MKSNLKFILAFIGIAILIYSGICNAFIVNNISLDTYKVKGYSVVLLGTIMYLYGLKTEKKLIYLLSYIITIIFYVYSIYLILSTASIANSQLENGETSLFFVGIGSGTYIYIASSILFLISIFVPNYNKNEIKDNHNNTELTNKLGITENNKIPEDKYLLCKYIYGCKELNSYSDGALKINEDNSISIIVLNENNTIQEKKITYNEIKNINIKNSVVITEMKPQTSDNTLANTILASAIIGGSVAPLAASRLSNQINEYSKIKEKMIYEIIIEFNTETIMLQTKINPQKIVYEIKSKINVHQ